MSKIVLRKIQLCASASDALLAYSAKNYLCPLEWGQALEDIKQKPGYIDPAKALELIADHLEKSASEIDLSELLELDFSGKATNQELTLSRTQRAPLSHPFYCGSKMNGVIVRRTKANENHLIRHKYRTGRTCIAGRLPFAIA